MKGDLDRADREVLRSTLAHDVKTPLAVIAGYAELLRIRDDDRIRAEAPSLILEAAQRLSREIDALIDKLVELPPPSVPEPALAPRPEPGVEGTFRILLVDDDSQLRGLLRVTIPADEYELLEAGDGAEALALARREQPDLVILDWQLPERSGAEVLAEVKSWPEAPSVLVLTAYSEADPAGADAFLLKPFSPVRLLDVVDDLLHARATGV